MFHVLLSVMFDKCQLNQSSSVFSSSILFPGFSFSSVDCWISTTSVIFSLFLKFPVSFYYDFPVA